MSWKPPTLFSQNFEDLYLWRIFKEEEKGFYIDVYACHPENKSSTKIFYDQGWQGINIEPAPSLFSLFQQARPRDTNLPVLISRQNGRKTINIVGDSGHPPAWCESWTSAPLEFKDKQQAIEVESRTLYEIISAHAPVAIDFLKVDTQGLKADVIISLSGDRLPTSIKPKVIIVRAVNPMSSVSESSRDECKTILEGWGYLRFLFDGINDYFCLQHNFTRYSAITTLPPNVLDGIPLTPEAFQAVLTREHMLTHNLEDLHQKYLSLERELPRLHQKEALAIKEAEELQKTHENTNTLFGEYIVLREQWNDLREEVLRLHLANSRLCNQKDECEKKLAWLRSQRKTLLELLRESNTIMSISRVANWCKYIHS